MAAASRARRLAAALAELEEEAKAARRDVVDGDGGAHPRDFRHLVEQDAVKAPLGFVLAHAPRHERANEPRDVVGPHLGGHLEGAGVLRVRLAIEEGGDERVLAGKY